MPRPKGSKNKIQRELVTEQIQTKNSTDGRGRPKGSKNKTEEEKSIIQPVRKGRPIGMKTTGKRTKKIKTNKQTKTIQPDKLTCSICGILKPAIEFYRSTNPFHVTQKLPYCKDCLKIMCFDENYKLDLNKVKKVLQEIDRPFLYDLFKQQCSAEGDSIGNYCRVIMSLPQYKNLTYRNSLFEPQHELELNQSISWDKDTISDDVVELFGAGYSRDEYQAMLKKYNFLKNNYPDVTNLHIEALVTYVRYKVKEEFAVAAGDVGAAKQWGELSMKAAEKAKIQPSQLSKADLQGGLNSFGELIKAVEQSVDIIPILPQFKFRPNDALDFVIWCYVNYIRDLKGLPICEYKDVYNFYDKRKEEYIEQYGDPYNIFTNDITLENREKIKKYITPIDKPDLSSDYDSNIKGEEKI